MAGGAKGGSGGGLASAGTFLSALLTSPTGGITQGAGSSLGTATNPILAALGFGGDSAGGRASSGTASNTGQPGAIGTMSPGDRSTLGMAGWGAKAAGLGMSALGLGGLLGPGTPFGAIGLADKIAGWAGVPQATANPFSGYLSPTEIQDAFDYGGFFAGAAALANNASINATGMLGGFNDAGDWGGGQYGGSPSDSPSSDAQSGDVGGAGGYGGGDSGGDSGGGDGSGGM